LILDAIPTEPIAVLAWIYSYVDNSDVYKNQLIGISFDRALDALVIQQTSAFFSNLEYAAKFDRDLTELIRRVRRLNESMIRAIVRETALHPIGRRIKDVRAEMFPSVVLRTVLAFADSDLPLEIDDIVLRAVSADSKDRYADAESMLVDLRQLSAKLNPLPERFTRLSDIPGRRTLCHDKELDERVAIRLISSTAATSEFTEQCNLLRDRVCNKLQDIEGAEIVVPLRQFTNEQFVGISCQPTSDSNLHQQFGGETDSSITPLQEFCDSMATVCDVASKLHAEGLVHCFLSPYSITVNRDGLRIDDAGLGPVFHARWVSKDAMQSLESLGASLPFMSPQLLAATSPPSPTDDVYSIGAILYYLLTGKHPVPQEDRHRLILGANVTQPEYNVREHNRIGIANRSGESQSTPCPRRRLSAKSFLQIRH
jgi:hypothetical protein